MLKAMYDTVQYGTVLVCRQKEEHSKDLFWRERGRKIQAIEAYLDLCCVHDEQDEPSLSSWKSRSCARRWNGRVWIRKRAKFIHSGFERSSTRAARTPSSAVHRAFVPSAAWRHATDPSKQGQKSTIATNRVKIKILLLVWFQVETRSFAALALRCCIRLCFLCNN